MGLGCKVNHSIGLMIVKQLIHELRIANVTLCKMVYLRWEVRYRSVIPGIG
jgi:hypothetical protein